MRRRWQSISRVWDANKASANSLNLLGRLDYHRELSSQLEWQENNDGRPVRVAYTKSGEPTATIIEDTNIVIDHLLYWIPCKDLQEANYLMAIINSDALATAVNQYTTPNWAGNTRDLHKHLWKLPTPEFDRDNLLHATLAKAGERAAAGAAQRLAELRAERGERLTVTIARRELRKWLRESLEGAAIETLIPGLIGQPLAGEAQWKERWEGRPGGRLVLSAAASLEAARLEREAQMDDWGRSGRERQACR